MRLKILLIAIMMSAVSLSLLGSCNRANAATGWTWKTTAELNTWFGNTGDQKISDAKANVANTLLGQYFANPGNTTLYHVKVTYNAGWTGDSYGFVVQLPPGVTLKVNGNTISRSDGANVYYMNNQTLNLKNNWDDGLFLVFNGSPSQTATIYDEDHIPPPTIDEYSISDVTSNSVRLNWSLIGQPSLSKIKIRIISTMDNNMDGKTFLYDKTLNTSVITGLKPASNYIFVLSKIDASGNDSATADPINGQIMQWVTTLKTAYNVKLMAGSKEVYRGQVEYANPLPDLSLQTTDYTKVEILSGEGGKSVFSKSGLSASQYISLPATLFQDAVLKEDRYLKIVVRAYKSVGYDDYTYWFDTTRVVGPGGVIGDYDPIDSDIPDMPTTPQKPDSNWDLVGWLKYLIDWVVYVVQTVVWVIRQAADMIVQITDSTKNLTTTVTSFFSFLPNQVVTVMSLGMLVAVILRVFKR